MVSCEHTLDFLLSASQPSFSDRFIPVSIALFIWWKLLFPPFFLWSSFRSSSTESIPGKGLKINGISLVGHTDNPYFISVHEKAICILYSVLASRGQTLSVKGSSITPNHYLIKYKTKRNIIYVLKRRDRSNVERSQKKDFLITLTHRQEYKYNEKSYLSVIEQRGRSRVARFLWKGLQSDPITICLASKWNIWNVVTVAEI